MSNSRCVFCGHSNPAEARYCNDCASPLHLKPCNECDAINDRSARSCYKCGADFPAERVVEDARPVSVTMATHRHGGGRDPSNGDPVDTLQRRVRIESPRHESNDVEILARVRPLAAAFRSSLPVSQRLQQIVPVPSRQTKEQRHHVMRGTLATLLIAGMAIGGYFGFRNQPQLQNASGQQQATVDAAPSVPVVNVPQSNAAKSVGVAVGATASFDESASSSTQGRIRTTVVAAPQASIEPPAETPAPSPVARAPDRRPAVAPKDSAFRDAGALAVHAPVRDRRNEALLAEQDRLRSCTDEVAALGLCMRRPEAQVK